ncbi:MAG: triose-phosphate isomerase [Candidatus Coatesbacteria bacterium RBG_13_66_14]|uniref:Triosephosphate isomerase n=1 Tax=Candidatus Coatesbacteria bacterium RBG_13_66_14 TaxID=1817816 RepID=A0A1F5F4D2_9BACT|nr:MAG: triose-phosphate isomerase [Candidatus Coatesbacteria bacterium RBG_13_66_14]
MHLSPREVAGYAGRFAPETANLVGTVDLLVCPSFPALPAAVAAFRGTHVAVGAQNMHQELSGAYTGEVSGAALVDLGVGWVILGHSERRHVFGETDALVLAKLKRAHELGLKAIVCVGELLEERDRGETEAVLRRQFSESLGGAGPALVTKTTLAYEPVWAIGTGRTATPETAQEAHRFLRGLLEKALGAASEGVRILYGGSVKPDNAAELMAQADVNGVLVGGASLDPEGFAAIARAGA